MLTGMLVGISLAVAAVGIAIAIVFWDVASAGGNNPSRWESLWREPFTAVQTVFDRAASAARAVARWRFLQQRPHGPHDVVAEVMAGATEAIDLSPQRGLSQSDPRCKTRRFARLGVTAPEALELADYLRAHQPAQQVREIQERAQVNASTTRRCNCRGHRAAGISCPLLTAEESCAAYPVRPLACRGWCPISRADKSGAAEAVIEPQFVPLDAYAYAVSEGAEQGLATSLTEAGMDGAIYELNSALATALETPAATAKWLRGEPVFAGCKRMGSCSGACTGHDAAS